jgi:hypothetical protein
MRKLGYTFLVVGFIWAAFFALDTNPVARATSRTIGERISQKQDYTRRDVLVAIGDSAYWVANFAAFGFVGALLMLTGGIILGRASKRSTPPEQPLMRSHREPGAP